ncbi:MAG: hypothetical protein KIT45_11465 [Fimbriimonadia bacterium]|nr:hypothetical protein [Fimbriimonadia bacterium]
MMILTIRARFDGKVIVPEEALELPTDRPLEIQVQVLEQPSETEYEALTIEERITRYKKFAGQLSGSSVSLEHLRRENFYEDNR